MFCPSCGSRFQEGSSYCYNCGHDLRQILDQPTKFYTVERDLEKSQAQRKFTDNVISPKWIVVPIVSVCATYGVLIYAIYATLRAFTQALSTSPPAPTTAPSIPNLNLLYLIAIIPDFFFLYLFYMLIKRRNQHFERQRRLFYYQAVALRQLSISKGEGRTEPYLTYIDSMPYYQNFEEEKSATFLVVLLIVPVVNFFIFLYVLHFLSSDFYKHEQTEDKVLSSLATTFSILGVDTNFKREQPIPKRNLGFYIVVTLLTAGFFSLYWDYVLITDPNGHFRDQEKFENFILSNSTDLSPIAAI